MWKLLYDRIATKEQLHKRGIVLTTNCDLCPASMEIVKHLCNECNMAIMLGKMILLLLASFSMLQFLFMVRLSHTSCGFIARINTIMHVSSSSLSYYGVCDYIKMNVYLRYCPGFLQNSTIAQPDATTTTQVPLVVGYSTLGFSSPS